MLATGGHWNENIEDWCCGLMDTIVERAVDVLAAQSQQLAGSAKQLLTSAQSGGFGFQPEAADTMIKALQESIDDLDTLRHHWGVISQAPKLGRTPTARVVSPFTQRVAIDEQGIVRTVRNLRQILTDMIAAYQEAKKNYTESDHLAAGTMRKLGH